MYSSYPGEELEEISSLESGGDAKVIASWIAARAAAISAAGDTLDSFIGRAIILTQDATASHGETIAELQGALARVSAEWKASARRLQRHRSAWFDKHADEMDAAEKILQGGSRLCAYEGAEAEVVSSSVSALLPLVDSDAILPRLPSIVSFDHNILAPIQAALLSGTSLQVAASASHSTVVGPTRCVPGPNTFRVSIRDQLENTVKCVRPADVTVKATISDVGPVPITPAVLFDPLPTPGIADFVLQLPIPVNKNATPMLTFDVELFGQSLLRCEFPLVSEIEGKGLMSFTSPVWNNGQKTGNLGMVITADGSHLAYSNWTDYKIHVYSLPDFTYVRGIDGHGDAKPLKICLADNGNILAVDGQNKRIWEVTLTGKHVRFIGTDVIDAAIRGIACSTSHIAVGKYGTGKQLMVFDVKTGALVSAFGDKGRNQGELYDGCVSLRFTADGSQFAVTEYGNNRVSVFTPTGEFVRCFGVGLFNYPRDCEIAPDGSLIVCDESDKVYVINWESGEVVRTFTLNAAEQKLCKPTSLCAHGRLLYVLNLDCPRVDVFA